jgi:hypothetical protein
MFISSTGLFLIADCFLLLEELNLSNCWKRRMLWSGYGGIEERKIFERRTIRLLGFCFLLAWFAND